MALHRGIAWALIALGVVQLFLGVYWSWEVWVRVAQDGLFDAIDPWMDRNAAFWFTYLSLPVMFSGVICLRLLRDTGRPLPRVVGYWLLGLGALGTVFMPASGFFLLLIFGGLALLPVES
jgi:Family of unknown function (DUF6463)